MPIAGVLSWDRCDPEALLGRGLSAAKTHPDEECRVWGSQIQGIAVGVLGRSGLSGPDEFHRLEERDIALATRFPRLLKDQSIYEVVAQADGDKATLWEAVHKASARFGDWYALIGTCGATLVGARDPIGQCPLFFGSTSELHAFSSTRKALWAMGISRPQVFPSGVAAEFSIGMQRCKRTANPHIPALSSLPIEKAANILSALTCTSIKEVGGTTGRVGILFSGGLDSSAIAAAAQNLGLKTYLYTGVFEDSRFAISIERSADALGMDLKLEVVPEDSVEDALGHVIWAIESSDPLQVCVALPLNVAVKAAVRNGEDVLLSGSGADELFGGYSRYLDILRYSGENGLRNAMFGDLSRLGEADLLRDGTIGETNRIHLFAPFLNLNLVNLALSFPIAYRVTEPADRMRKHVLRLAAQRLGVPVEVTCLPKKAAQYSSGSLKMVRRLAKAYGLGIREYLDSIFMKVFDGLIPT